MEIVELPAVALEVVIVIVELPDPPIDDGLNDGDAPVGNPPALRPTLPLKPFKAPIVTV